MLNVNDVYAGIVYLLAAANHDTFTNWQTKHFRMDEPLVLA
jgi:hypothetical protein